MNKRHDWLAGQTREPELILLLGCNFCKDGNYDRSDAILVASPDPKTGTVKLASILRDIQADLHEYGMEKINAALLHGGPEFAVRIINECFHLSIRHYILVDMYGLVNVIDLLGGIDVEITEMERIFLNCWVRDLAMQFQDGIFPPPLEKAGLVHMDGRTALSHARNRAIGTDFARADRQRTVLKAMAEKIKEESDPVKLIRLFFRGLRYVKTDLSALQIASMALPVWRAGNLSFPSIRIPVDNTYKASTDGNWHFEIDFEANAQELGRFFSEEV